MNKIDEKTWDALPSDPTYPCAKCKSVENPQECTNKKCLPWRLWITRDYLKTKLAWYELKYRRGRISKAQYEDAVRDINERMEKNERI